MAISTNNNQDGNYPLAVAVVEEESTTTRPQPSAPSEEEVNANNIDTNSNPIEAVIYLQQPLLVRDDEEQHQVSAATTMTTTAGGNNQLDLSRQPCRSLQQCPKCNFYNVSTRIHTYPSYLSWTAFFLLFFIFWPLCWLPFCCICMKQTDHYCNNCNGKIATIPAFSDCCSERRG